MRFLAASKSNATKICTVQNPYSLLNRLFEIGSAEICHRENVGLLAYSPLGFGVLSGKYLNGKKPADGRVTLFPNFARYSSDQSNRATEMYAQLAADNNMTITQMSLAFVNDRSFVTSNIIGATKIEQLKENIASHEITHSEEVLKEIEAIHNIIPDPAP